MKKYTKFVSVKHVWTILFWVAAIGFVSTIIMCLGYRFVEAVFISTLFAPCCLFVIFYFSKNKPRKGKKYALNTAFALMGAFMAEVFLFIVAHYVINVLRYTVERYFEWSALPSLLVNPVFIAFMIATLSVGYWFFKQWLDKQYPSPTKAITFLSNRKPVSLMPEEIIYVESNDSITTVNATDGRKFRNKTTISQWDAILDERFIRIHRSFIENTDMLFIN